MSIVGSGWGSIQKGSLSKSRGFRMFFASTATNLVELTRSLTHFVMIAGILRTSIEKLGKGPHAPRMRDGDAPNEYRVPLSIPGDSEDERNKE